MTGAWTDGNIEFKGLPFTGAHGPYPSLKKKPLFSTNPGPGYAKNGSFSDPRTGEKPFLGRLQSSWAKYKGAYRNGKSVIFSYTVGSANILDMPQLIDGVIVRSIENNGGELKMAVAAGKAEIQGSVAYIDGCAFTASSGAFSQVENDLVLTVSAKNFHLTYNKAANIGEAKKMKIESVSLGTLTKGGAAQWPETFKPSGKISTAKGAYVVDNVGVPYNNKYDKRMRISAVDFFSDGTTAAVSTWDGSVWIVKNIDDKLDKVEWKRFASGLHEPMGLRIVKDKIYTVADDQITRFHDLNNDGEADFYECFNNDWDLTSGFHAFCFDLQTDKQGNFYFAFGAPVRGGGRSFERLGRHHGSILRISPDGSKLDIYASGFRAPNGIGVGPNGEVTTGDNEGTYVPRSPINWVKEGGFGGVVDTFVNYTDLKSTPTVKQRSGSRKKHLESSEMPKPLVWLPKNVDNSGGGQAWVTTDKWGPLKGELLHMSYGQSSLYLVLKEEKNGIMQGGVVKFPIRLTSSAMRARFNDKDGQLYIVGLKGWQTNAAKNGGFDRIRYTGKALKMPVAVKTTAKGVSLTFSEKLDPELANDPKSYSLRGADIWWSHNYGTKEYNLGQRPVTQGSKQGWTRLNIKSAKLKADGKTVDIEVENMQPAHELELSIDVESDKGDEIIHKFWFTIHNL
jgi:glucose/arabinose dehydrogenase